MTKLEEHTAAGGCHGPGDWTAPLCHKRPVWRWNTFKTCLDHRTRHHSDTGRVPSKFYGEPIARDLDFEGAGP